MRDDEIGYYEYEAGFLRPEACVAAQLALAEKYGATIRRNEKVLGFEENSSGVTVSTDKDTYIADRLIVSAGAWLPQLIARQYAQPFKIRRQLLFWFAPKGPIAPFELGKFPIYIWEIQGRPQAIYGFPAIDGENGGIKVATPQYETETTPEAVDRTVSDAEKRAMYDYIAPYLPGFSQDMRQSRRLPLHRHARRGVRHRHASRHAARDHRLALLGPRLQALGRHRRSARRDRHRRQKPPRPQPLQIQPLRLSR